MPQSYQGDAGRLRCIAGALVCAVAAFAVAQAEEKQSLGDPASVARRGSPDPAAASTAGLQRRRRQSPHQGDLRSAGSAGSGDPRRALGDQANRLPPPLQRTIDFRRDVYPLLTRCCFACHRGEEPSSGARLDDHDRLTVVADKHPLIVPGESAASPLIHRVAGLIEDQEMPPEGPPLSTAEIGLLRAWIDQGAAWDFDLLPRVRAVPPEKHWAFQPVQRPEVPKVDSEPWVRNPIDRFIAVRQAAIGVQAVEEASPRTLLRRLSLDLTGLPPTPEEIDAFNQSAIRNPHSAFDEVVERLLASPHYGERWARHWLDVARWAETEGYESNHPRNFAWRYRDWVIESFNRDEPLTEFVRKQLAGDAIEPYADENLIATGFLAAARLSSNEEDKPLQRNDVLVDIVNATGSALLGLTFNCAQCHDHKFDPLPQHDYYRLQAFFVQGQPANLVLKDKSLWDEYNAAKAPEFDSAAQLKKLLYDRAHERLKAAAREKQFTPNQIEQAIPETDRKLYDELVRKLTELEKRMPPTPQTWAYGSPASPTQIEVLPMKGFYPLHFERDALLAARAHLLVRGDVHQRGPSLTPGIPAVLAGPMGIEEDSAPTTRQALAAWLTDRKNPLTARVWVNRIWQAHFGRGLVATSGDFGLKGARPTHPQLLDWLAAEFMDHGWSTKHVQRLIVSSGTYRMSSSARGSAAEENARIDPQNKTYWRWQPRRVEAEVVRDALVTVSGELDTRLGGPSVPLEDEQRSRRRAMYQFQKREGPPLVQALFDGPNAATESCPQRHVSTTALQPLYLLNNTFVLERAEKLAERALSVSAADVERQVEAAFEMALGRLPDDEELSAARAYLAAAADSQSGLVRFCHTLLNLNEFVYIE